MAGPTKEQLYAKLLPVKKWKTVAALAAQFKLNDGLIDEIYTNNERDEDCLEEVISYWYQNGDFQHTWSEVVTALEAIGEYTLAEDISAAHSQLILIIKAPFNRVLTLARFYLHTSEVWVHGY